MRDREEPKIVAALAELCRERGVTCVVQVGAGDGYEADEIRKYTGCRAVAIEGCSDAERVFSQTEWHIAVIGATDGPTNFYVHDNRNLSGQIARESGERIEVVEQRRLDTFCREHDIKPDALIIDTEGTTLDVLEGCGDLLNNLKVVYAECQTSVLRPGMRLLGEVSEFLATHDMTMRVGPPSYGSGGQGNYTWVRNETKPDAA